MPYLLLGSDSYTKHQFIRELAAKTQAEVISIAQEDNLPTIDQLGQNDLFAKAKIFVFINRLPDYLVNIPKTSDAKNRVVVMVDSLDKRKKENKDLLQNPNLEVKDFSLPHGAELNLWLVAKIAELGGKISSEAVEELAIRLGRDNGQETKVAGKIISVTEVFDLFQAAAELKKLVDFAAGSEITKSDVEALVSENGEVDVFELTNAIADRQKQTALNLMQKFLGQAVSSDDKAGVIQLNALLSEQFRNIVLLQELLKLKTSDDKILEQTAWKPGRLFVLKKVAARFEQKKVWEFLNKLEALDQELKTSQIPARVILDLIVAQLLA